MRSKCPRPCSKCDEQDGQGTAPSCPDPTLPSAISPGISPSLLVGGPHSPSDHEPVCRISTNERKRGECSHNSRKPRIPLLPKNQHQIRSPNEQCRRTPISCPGTCTFMPQRPRCHVSSDTHTKIRVTCDQVHRYEHCTERSQLGQHVVDLIIRVRHLDRDLREVIRVRPRQNLFIVVQILRHRDQVVLVDFQRVARVSIRKGPYLDIRKIEALYQKEEKKSAPLATQGRKDGQYPTWVPPSSSRCIVLPSL